MTRFIPFISMSCLFFMAMAVPASAQDIFLSPKTDKEGDLTRRERLTPFIPGASSSGMTIPSFQYRSPVFKKTVIPPVNETYARLLKEDAFKGFDVDLLKPDGREPATQKEFNQLVMIKTVPQVEAIHAHMKNVQAEMVRQHAALQKKYASSNMLNEMERLREAASQPSSGDGAPESPPAAKSQSQKNTIYLQPDTPAKPSKVFRNY